MTQKNLHVSVGKRHRQLKVEMDLSLDGHISSYPAFSLFSLWALKQRQSMSCPCSLNFSQALQASEGDIRAKASHLLSSLDLTSVSHTSPGSPCILLRKNVASILPNAAEWKWVGDNRKSKMTGGR